MPGKPGVRLKRLFSLEAQSALQTRHIAVFLVMAMVGVGLPFWMPTWPQAVVEFESGIFHVEGWAGVVQVDFLTGLMGAIYWVGVFDILRIYVKPVEEGYIDLLFSKPFRRRDFMLGRAMSSFVVLCGLGVCAGTLHAAAMAESGLGVQPASHYPYVVGSVLTGFNTGAGLAYVATSTASGLGSQLAAYVGTIAVVIGFSLLLLAIANVAMLRVRDGFAGLVVAFVVFSLGTAPSLVYIYRPDKFAKNPQLPDYIALPENLLWYPEKMATIGLPIAIGLGLLALLLVAYAGSRLDKRDVASA